MSTPAIVRNTRVDYLSANALGRALYAPVFEGCEQPANSARFTFLDPAAHDFYADWERTAKDLVAHLRSEAGHNPVKPQRIAENIDVFDFEFTADEIAAIDGLDTGRRGGPEPEAITLETFGRDIPEA